MGTVFTVECSVFCMYILMYIRNVLDLCVHVCKCACVQVCTCVQINLLTDVFADVMPVKAKKVVRSAHTSRRELPLPNQKMGMDLCLGTKTVMTGTHAI